jgi:hypothetical protein
MPKKQNSFNELNTGFSEIYLWKNKKEYISTISSLWMTYLGYIGLTNDNSMKIIYNLLFSNGIFSALMHYTKKEGWGHLDGMTMILAVSLGNFELTNFFMKHLNKKKIINKLYNIIYPTIIFAPLVINKYMKNKFDIIFLILSLQITMFIPLMKKYRNLFTEKYQIDCLTNILKCFKQGAKIVVLAAIIWAPAEIISRNNKIDIKIKKMIAQFHPHSIWHILAGYGFYKIIFSIHMLKKFEANKESIDVCNQINKSLTKFIPKFSQND